MPVDSVPPPKPLAQSQAPLLERTLGADWRCLTDAQLRVGGEVGPIDLLAVHPRHGVVLAALLRKGEVASPDEAAAAFRAMLKEFGIAERFPGEIKVAAVAQEFGRRDRLAEAIHEVAGSPSESPPEPAWVEWLMERMAETAKGEPHLVAPSPSDEPPPAADKLETPGEPILPPLSRRGPSWPTALAVASLLLLAGLLLFHAGLLHA